MKGSGRNKRMVKEEKRLTEKEEEKKEMSGGKIEKEVIK